MRLMVCFDLPVGTANERKDYQVFRKFLIKEGFLMMQNSIYTKIALNDVAVKLIKDRIIKNSPKGGLVQLLVITERQFASIELIVGEVTKRAVNSMDRLVII